VCIDLLAFTMGGPRSGAKRTARAAKIRSLRVANKFRHAKWWADDIDTILARYSAAACGDGVAEAASEKVFWDSRATEAASEKFFWDNLEREWNKMETEFSKWRKGLPLAEMAGDSLVADSSFLSQLPAGSPLLAISHLLKLASPTAAQETAIDEALLSLQSDGGAAWSSGESLVDVPSGHALANFLASAMTAVEPRMTGADLSNIQLVILPAHVNAFTEKLHEFHSSGRPWKPCVAFHSTPHPDAWQGIAKNNFDPEKCGRHDGGYYGRGTYFHTNVARGGSGGSKTFLSLILKGIEYELTYRLGCPLEKGYDSHIAKDRKFTGETVIFHQSQMIPIISYDFRPACFFDDDGMFYYGSECDYDEPFCYYECDYWDDGMSDYGSECDYDEPLCYYECDYWGYLCEDFVSGPCPDCSSCSCNGRCVDSYVNCRKMERRKTRKSLPRPEMLSGARDRPHNTAPATKLRRGSAPLLFWQRQAWRRLEKRRTTEMASERRSQ